MIQILSIDWDYYIDITNEKRNSWFPYIPDDLLTEEDRENLWAPCYDKFGISGVGILEEDFEKTKHLIRSCKKNSRLIKTVNDSHRYLYDLVYKILNDNINVHETILIYNIDHHHDMYSYRIPNEKVNCSNWAGVLREELGDILEYRWIKRDDSEEYSLAGKVECAYGTFNDIKSISFDSIYLCKSGAWSPPHLDCRYKELVDVLLE